MRNLILMMMKMMMIDQGKILQLCKLCIQILMVLMNHMGIA